MKYVASRCFVFAAALLFLSACVHRRGSGHVISEKKSVAAFHELSVAGPIDVFITQGPQKDIEIRGDDKLLQYVEIENNGGELTIKLRKGGWMDFHDNFKVYLSVPNLEKINLAGSGTISLKDGYKSEDELKTTIAGSGDINGKFDVPVFGASVAGSGSYNVEGQARRVEVEVIGSGDFNGANLLAEEASASVAGSGNVNVSASVKLEANIAGSGDIRYKGNPQVEKHVSGSGSVSKD